MKVVNIMNFVRRIDERIENSTEQLLAFTSEQLDLINQYDVDNTFLLQYDAVNDEDFVSLFKEKATERTELGLLYLKDICTTRDAVYENLPVVDTMTCPEENKKCSGLTIDTRGNMLKAERISDGVLKVSFGKDSVTFYEDRIEINAERLIWRKDATKASVDVGCEGINFVYKGHSYRLAVKGCVITKQGEDILLVANNEQIILFPQKN